MVGRRVGNKWRLSWLHDLVVRDRGVRMLLLQRRREGEEGEEGQEGEGGA